MYTEQILLYCTSALKPSSSGTSATELHSIRENKEADVSMICFQACWDAIFFISCCLWDPDGHRVVGWWRKTARQLPPAGRDTGQSAARFYSVLLLLHLITSSATSELSAHFWSWNIRNLEKKKKFTTKGAFTNPPKIKMILIHSWWQAVRYDLGHQPHGSSKCSNSSFFLHAESTAASGHIN